jgi:hypothetical protein
MMFLHEKSISPIDSVSTKNRRIGETSTTAIIFTERYYPDIEYEMKESRIDKKGLLRFHD